MNIKSISAFEILDSRGNPTVKALVTLEDGSQDWAAVPSGASTGTHEAVELRDGDPKRFAGNGVLTAVSNVNTLIATALIGMDASDQQKIDQTMIVLDGTENKAKLGANAILAVSLATARAQAQSEHKELFEYLTKFNPDFNGTYNMPIPEMNVLNGGKHANWATDIQEYMLFPIGADSTTEAIRMGAEIYQQLKNILKDQKYSISVGDEGGFAPQVTSNEEPFQLLTAAIEKAGYKLGTQVTLGIDAAASEFYKNGQYQLNKEGKSVTSDEFAEILKNLLTRYPIVSMEDIFAEDDWSAFQKFTETTAGKIQIVGDDLYVTNTKRLQRGIEEKTSNSILIKVNQIGSLSETIDAILLARRNHMTAIISHRSGETEDPFIADLAVAMGTGQIKAGAPARSERVAKYNRLIEIERHLGDLASYAQFPFRTR